MSQNSAYIVTACRLFVLMAGLSITFARLTFADSCSLTLQCGQCNSGSFTASCMCVEASNWQCTGCSGTCTGGGCCCGHTTTPPISSSCSKVGCGFTPACAKLTLPGGSNPLLLASTSPNLAGLTLSALGRVMQGKGAISTLVSGANAPIETDVPPETGIEVTNVKLSATANTFNGASFTIKNLNDNNLISYSLSLNLYFDTNPDRPVQMGVTEDGWFLNQYVLKPGDSKEGHITLSLKAPAPVRLTLVKVVLDYVEFSGGEVHGENALAVGKALTKSRDSKIELLQSYCAKLKSAQSTNIASLIQSDLRSAQRADRVRQLGTSMLLSYVNVYGADGFANVCSGTPPPRAY